MGDRAGYIRAENAAPPTPAPTAAVVTETAATPAPNAEMDARHKAFFEALYAKSAYHRSDSGAGERPASASDLGSTGRES